MHPELMVGKQELQICTEKHNSLAQPLSNNPFLSAAPCLVLTFV